jgi:hypothetical protein
MRPEAGLALCTRTRTHEADLPRWAIPFKTHDLAPAAKCNLGRNRRATLAQSFNETFAKLNPSPPTRHRQIKLCDYPSSIQGSWTSGRRASQIQRDCVGMSAGAELFGVIAASRSTRANPRLTARSPRSTSSVMISAPRRIVTAPNG